MIHGAPRTATYLIFDLRKLPKVSCLPKPREGDSGLHDVHNHHRDSPVSYFRENLATRVAIDPMKETRCRRMSLPVRSCLGYHASRRTVAHADRRRPAAPEYCLKIFFRNDFG